MASTRWGADTRMGVDDAVRRLIDAAESCFDHYGVAKTSVEDIADEAKVSRATVYRYFAGGRDEQLDGIGADVDGSELFHSGGIFRPPSRDRLKSA